MNQVLKILFLVGQRMMKTKNQGKDLGVGGSKEIAAIQKQLGSKQKGE